MPCSWRLGLDSDTEIDGAFELNAYLLNVTTSYL